MRIIDVRSRFRAGAAAALACVAGLTGTAALAGGPLFVVPSGDTVKPARWQGTVRVYTDQGALGVLSNAQANQLVQDALLQWSSVPTSSFRAHFAGTLPQDITGANAGSVIGAANGGGIQVIYDSDGTVIADFIGAGFGVLGIATPEFLAGEGSTQIVEGWVIVNGQPEGLEDVPTGGPVAGVVTHEFGHAINLAHSQTNGYYSRNEPNPDWGLPAGPEQAGPDQCGRVVPAYPTAEQIETMYPLINPYPSAPHYNSPQMATVNVPDDIAALSSIYPAPHYAATTGTIRGRVVAKDGTSPLTGINVIARRLGAPFEATSRISGDLTQGRLGPDGNFIMTGLVPGAGYLLHIDQIADGGFSTPKAILLGPEEYWNDAESADATVDDACASTPITLAAGETRQLTVAVNGIARAPAFTHIPYTLPSSLSGNGQRIVGVYGTQSSPFWLWDKQSGAKTIGGSGYYGAISGNGRVVGGSVGKEAQTEWGPLVQERAATWTKERGWTDIARDYAGCDTFHSAVYDLSGDGSAAVGLAWVDCRNAYAFKWTPKTGMTLLHKVSENQQCEDPWSGETYDCEGSSRANATSGSGEVTVGWEEIPAASGLRVASIWRGDEQMLLRDPAGDNWAGGWIGEAMDVNAAGTVVVGDGAGPQLKDAWRWTPATGVESLGRYPGQVCYFDWWTGAETCEDRATSAFSVSDDGKVITGASRLANAGVDDGAIYTPKMGWMLLGDFLQKQGVLDASRWLIYGGRVSGNGKVLTGTGVPLGADYYHGFRLELDQVYVCHGKGSHSQTLRVGFPDAMDLHLSHGDAVGLCRGQAPL